MIFLSKFVILIKYCTNCQWRGKDHDATIVQLQKCEVVKPVQTVGLKVDRLIKESMTHFKGYYLYDAS